MSFFSVRLTLFPLLDLKTKLPAGQWEHFASCKPLVSFFRPLRLRLSESILMYRRSFEALIWAIQAAQWAEIIRSVLFKPIDITNCKTASWHCPSPPVSYYRKLSKKTRKLRMFLLRSYLLFIIAAASVVIQQSALGSALIKNANKVRSISAASQGPNSERQRGKERVLCSFRAEGWGRKGERRGILKERQ